MNQKQEQLDFRSKIIRNYSEPAGLYIHFPFCKTKCPYCDFYSVTDTSLIDLWIEALEKEMSFYCEDFDIFDSLYLGGGTPSLLNNFQLKKIWDGLMRYFRFHSDTEVTIEVNPDDITTEKLDTLIATGFNRLSVGVQSFNESELRFLNRRHDSAKAIETVIIAKACGFNNIGMDLMYGFEGQTSESWSNTMKTAIDLKPAHLSCYQLTLEETTPFGRLKKEGKLKSITEEEERNLFLMTSKFLRLNNFVHYEVSNYGKDEDHFSRHNIKYWSHIPYIGLGPGAHSFHNNKRWWNCRSVENYCYRLLSGERPVEGSEKLSVDQLRLERLYLGMRTKWGASIDDIGKDSSTHYVLSQLKKSGFLKIRDEMVIPTEKGYLIADRLPLMFA